MQIGAQAVGMVAIFALTPIELRRMGGERYGILVLTTTVGSYLGLLELGVGWALTRFLATTLDIDGPGARRYLGAGLAITLSTGVPVALVLLVVASPLAGHVFSVSPANRADAVFALRAVALTVPLALMLSIASGVCRALGRFSSMAVVAAATPVLINVVWAIAAGHSYDVRLVALMQLGVLFVGTAFLSIGSLRAAGPALRPMRPARSDVMALLRFGGWTTVSRFGFVALTTVDTLLVAALLPVRLLPTYALPFAIASRITIFCSTAVSVLMADLSRRHAINPTEAGRVAARVDPIVAAITCAAVATLGFAALPFLEGYVGRSFATSGAAAALAFLAFAFGAYGISSLDGVYLEAAGHPRAPALAMVAGAVVGLSTLVALTPTFGVAGAACGVASGAFVTGSIQLVAAARLRNETVRRRIARLARSCVGPFVAAAAATAVFHFAHVPGLLATAVTLAVAVAAAIPSVYRNI